MMERFLFLRQTETLIVAAKTTRATRVERLAGLIFAAGLPSLDKADFETAI